MRTIRFGRTNVEVPTISLGTWGHGGPNVSEGASVGWSGHDDRLAKEALVEAHRRGARDEVDKDVVNQRVRFLEGNSVSQSRNGSHATDPKHVVL